MLIRLYDSTNVLHVLNNSRRGRIDHAENGEDKLSFYIDTNDPNYQYISEENKVVYGDNEWVIKKIQDDAVECEVDFGFLKNSLLTGYAYAGATLSQLLTALLPSGWTVTGAESVQATFTAEYAYATPYEVIYDLQAGFDVRFVWKTVRRELLVRVPSQIQPNGKYISDQLNLKSLSFQGSTVGIATRLYPYGKDGLSISSVNEGIPYIDNTTYTSKVIVAHWVDERYENAQSLKDAAVEKLAEMALPVRSYECSVKDLAKLTNQYSNLTISLHDKMTLVSSERGLKVIYSVVKYVEYPDSPQDNVVTLSCVPETIQSMVQNDTKRLEEKIQTEIETLDYTTPAQLAEAIQRATDAITGNSGGYVVLYPANNPQELLIMNTPLRSTATKLWRFNLSGLGFSSHGYSGPYDLAMTMNGEINASMITVGTLTAIDISACTITGGTLNINNNCTIDATGHLYASGATFVGGTAEDIMKTSTIPPGKYQIGNTSPTYGLSATEISENVPNGVVYIPLASHTEGAEVATVVDCGTPFTRAAGEASGEPTTTYDAGTPASSRVGAAEFDGETPPDRTYESINFVVGKSYLWSGGGWTLNGNVTFSSSFFLGASDYDLWYCQATITHAGRTYSNKTLYLWLGGRWNAMTDGYGTSTDAAGVVSIIGGRITAEYIEALQITVDAAQISGTLTAGHIDATDLHVSAANIDGTITAGQVDVSGIISARGIVVGTDIYTSGTTTIDGGKITANSITASSIDTTNLSVDFANITGVLRVSDTNSHLLLSAGLGYVFIAGFSVLNTGTKSSISSNTNISMTSGNYTGVYVGTDGIHVCGKDANNYYKHFKVDASSGKMTAEDAEISGTLSGELKDGIKVGTGGHCTLNVYNSGHGNTGCTLSYDTDTYLRMGQQSQGDEVWLYSGRWLTIRAGGIGATSAGVTILGPYVTLGDSNTGTTNGRLYGNWTLNGSTIATTSDANKKNSIAPIGKKYETFFDLLSPVVFKYNSGTSGRLHIGFIAQEVCTALGEAELSTNDFAGYVKTKDESGDEFLCLRYEEFIALNTLEIQKLKARIAALEKKINS